MGCFWAARSRASIPEGDRVSTDSEPVIFDGKCRIQEKDCKGGCGCVIYEYRGSLTFNGTPGNLWIAVCRVWQLRRWVRTLVLHFRSAQPQWLLSPEQGAS